MVCSSVRMVCLNGPSGVLDAVSEWFEWCSNCCVQFVRVCVQCQWMIWTLAANAEPFCVFSILRMLFSILWRAQ